MIAVAAMIVRLAPRSLRAQEAGRADGSGQKQWAAVALGRVEPLSREIKIGAPGRTHCRRTGQGQRRGVRRGVAGPPRRRGGAGAGGRGRCSDRAAQACPQRPIRAAGSAERRKAEDAVADAERGFADARAAFDKVAADWRGGGGSEEALDAARAAFVRAEDRLRSSAPTCGASRRTRTRLCPTG